MARKILEVKKLVVTMLRTVEMLYMVRLTKLVAAKVGE